MFFMLSMNIYQAIQSQVQLLYNMLSAKFRTIWEAQPRMVLYPVPLLWQYSIHCDMLLSPALRSTLSRCREEKSRKGVPMTVETLPSRSTGEIVGYRELMCEGSPILREALRIQVSNDGTIELVPYSPRLTV